MVGRFLEPQRQLALAEAGLGNGAEAVRILDALLAKHADEDQPLLVGLLHKARAEVALQMNDRAQFDEHAAHVERHFRATKNPALITQWERLIQRAVRSGLRRLDEHNTAHAGDDKSENITQRRIVSEMPSARDPYDLALRLLVQESPASVGYLYLYHHNGMQLASATSTDVPPRELELELALRAQRIELAEAEDADANTQAFDEGEAAVPEQSAVRASLRAGAGPSEDQRVTTVLQPGAADTGADSSGQADDPVTQFVSSEPPPPNLGTPYRAFLLTTRANGKTVIVGGLVVRAGGADAPRIDAAILDSIARTLYERHSSVVG